ncbi:MAG TPA: S9 family peptidase [Gemmatimonas aurantiaca]|uniref:S9 family peptidase n=2 Tax=Gemmatimonas aurantiaca TaxID=173480 RepID=A0A3D4VC32_9BACT|nr:alpha/beta fold hydrolase [Gemmatimonas aurantiaca]BAH39698.1 putative S9C family peptidase [Gemmatimonas aurantiaca T-27]HCT58292.1 S9 family peptidase [Gemmatimonas aurantiaca]
MTKLRPWIAASLLAAGLTTSLDAQQGARPPRQVVPVDSARAALLYVSNRHEDHPVADYDRAMKEKQAFDSAFAARSKGVMKYSKISYKSSADGMEIPAYLFEPLTSKGAKAHPAMVWVHGGVHGNFDTQYLPYIIEATKKGYAIVAPEYRGSTGYGKAHHNAIDYGGWEVDDVQSAASVLKGLPYVDPARIGVMGWSHGGYITMLLLTREAKGSPFKAGVAMVPVTNLLYRLAHKGPSYQRSFSTQSRLSGLPFEQREEYMRRSPYYWVDSLKYPVLVHVATNDTDVTFDEARPLIDALRARQPKLAETKVYTNPTPGPVSVGHTFNRRTNRETLLRDDSPEQIDSWNLTWAFIEKHLGK